MKKLIYCFPILLLAMGVFADTSAPQLQLSLGISAKERFDAAHLPSDLPALVGGYMGKCASPDEQSREAGMIFGYFKTIETGISLHGLNLDNAFTEKDISDTHFWDVINGTTMGVHTVHLHYGRIYSATLSGSKIDGESYVAYRDVPENGLINYRTEYRVDDQGLVTKVSANGWPHAVYCTWYRKVLEKESVPLRYRNALMLDEIQTPKFRDNIGAAWTTLDVKNSRKITNATWYDCDSLRFGYRNPTVKDFKRLRKSLSQKSKRYSPYKLDGTEALPGLSHALFVVEEPFEVLEIRPPGSFIFGSVRIINTMMYDGASGELKKFVATDHIAPGYEPKNYPLRGDHFELADSTIESIGKICVSDSLKQ